MERGLKINSIIYEQICGTFARSCFNGWDPNGFSPNSGIVFNKFGLYYFNHFLSTNGWCLMYMYLDCADTTVHVLATTAEEMYNSLRRCQIHFDASASHEDEYFLASRSGCPDFWCQAL